MILTAIEGTAPDQIVALPCQMIGTGEPDTNNVSIETGEMPMVGKVSSDTILVMEDGSLYVRAVVVKVRRRAITVWVPGSFETANGKISLRRDWFESNARAERNEPQVGMERSLPPYWGHGWFHGAN